MPSGDDSLRRLRAAIGQLAADDAAEVVAQARDDARNRVRAILSDELSRSLLDQIEERLAVHRDDSAHLPPELETPVRAAAGDRPGSAWYVYGVITAEAALEESGPAGVERSRVEVVTEGSLAAVLSAVPADDFEDAPLRAHLADMQWVEQLARAHEAVLDWIRAQTTVVPMRMCTVYKSEGGVREFLIRDHAGFEETLAQLEGKAEWGVKVFSLPVRPAGPVEPDTPATGAAYLDQRRRELERQEHAAERVQEAAALIHEQLCGLACDGLVAPPQRPEASGHEGEMVLNGVYLVEDSSAELFASTVAELNAESKALGLDLVLTGPWPAYNFVSGTMGAAW
jgi:hypothetical protein